jgi:hypothetical protein
MQNFCHSLLQLRDQHHNKIKDDGNLPTVSHGLAELSEYGKPLHLRSDSTHAYQDFGTEEDSEEFANPSTSDGGKESEIKEDPISEQGTFRVSFKWLNADLIFLILAITVLDEDIEQVDNHEEPSSEQDSIGKKGISR